MKKAQFNWSGGKDSSLALYHVLQEERHEVAGLLTSFNGANNRVSMHGIHKNLIEAQARQLGFRLQSLKLPEQITMGEYDALMKEAMEDYKQRGIRCCIFGDIFLEDLKAYRERQLQKVGMEAVFPLWKRSTEELAKQFIDLGFKAVVVSVNGNKINQSFAGRDYDAQFLADLPAGVDPCGEYGEFHTFVYDGPIFDRPVPFQKGEIVARTYEQQDDSHDFNNNDCREKETTYYYQDLIEEG